MRKLVQPVLLGLSLLLMLPACSEESADTPPPTQQPRQAAQRAAEANAAPAAEANNATEELVANFQRAVSPPTARDPFTPPRPEVSASWDVTNDTQRECDLERNPLGDFLLSELSVMGIVTGTPLPRAMVVARGNPQAFIVSEGAYAGGRCTQLLTAIRDNELVFEFRSADPNVAPTETILQMSEERVVADVVGDVQ